MYESFFNLSQFPFPAAAKPQRYYPAVGIETARQNLSRAIDRAEGPGLLIAPAGMGKTLLLAVLAQEYKDAFEIVVLNSARLCSRRALLQAILYELRLPYRDLEEGELRLSLIDHLNFAAGSRGLLMLVDEAHALPLRLLEEIRMITNLVRDGQPRVQLVLAGLPSLEEKFASPKLESFNQRLAVRCYLDRLEPQDTAQYVRAQLAASGGNADGIFTPEALQAIHRATDGIPRLINQVCDHAMILACAGGTKRIGAEGIEEAWADLQQLPLPWNSRAPKRTPETSGIIEFGTLDEEESPTDGSKSLRFPSQGLDETLTPDERLERIEQELADLDEEFEPIGAIGPEIELNFATQVSPFSQPFSEEEVVIDRYASLDDEFYRDRQKVHSRVPDSLGSMLQALTPAPRKPVLTVTLDEPIVVASQPPHPPAGPVAPESTPEVPAGIDPVFAETESATVPDASPTAAPPIAGNPIDDRDLIIVEDEPITEISAPKAKRQEYRQLFAKLRQS